MGGFLKKKIFFNCSGMYIFPHACQSFARFPHKPFRTFLHFAGSFLHIVLLWFVFSLSPPKPHTYKYKPHGGNSSLRYQQSLSESRSVIRQVIIQRSKLVTHTNRESIHIWSTDRTIDLFIFSKHDHFLKHNYQDITHIYIYTYIYTLFTIMR